MLPSPPTRPCLAISTGPEYPFFWRSLRTLAPIRCLALGALLLLCRYEVTHARAAAVSEVVFDFSGPPGYPIGELAAGPDGTLFGTTFAGGGNGAGTVFTITADGVPRPLLEFTGNGTMNKGAGPAAGLLLASDGNFYGTTSHGGAQNLGTVFQLTPDGVLTTLAEFTGAGDFNRGALPYAALVDGGNGFLYGTTSKGGSSNSGTVFRISLADQTVETSVEFTGKTSFAKGAAPYSALVLGSDGRLYGTTSAGGTLGHGTIFALSTDGTFQTLVNFAGGGTLNKGSAPYAALVQGTNGKFYGTTARGGAGDFGTLFQITSAGALTTLVEFTGTTGVFKGAQPEARLIAGPSDTLYGTTYAGGAANQGTAFKITAGGKLTTLVEFTGKKPGRPGGTLQSGLYRATDGEFYGTTFRGGAADAGTVFRLSSTGTLTTLAEFRGLDLANASQPGIIIGSDGNNYGVSSSAGILGLGSVYRITFDGEYTTLAEFTGQGTVNRGANPRAQLAEGVGGFFGTTSHGGADDLGTVFKITKDGVLTTLAEFTGTGGANKGANPQASLIPDGQGGFYGTTNEGGAANLGTVFKLGSDGTLTTLVEFTGNGETNKGATPVGSLLLAPDHLLYGTTSRGGARDLGTIFSLTAAGELTTLVEFADGIVGPKGAYPLTGLARGRDGNFYGTTSTGGATGDGTIFSITPTGTLTTLVEFTNHRLTNKGSFPKIPLILAADGNFYGSTAFGGTLNEGTAFSMTPEGALTTLAELSYASAIGEGAYPEAPFNRGSDGNLYTATTRGGANGAGTVFRIRLRAATLKEEVVGLFPDGVRLRARVRGGTLGGRLAFQYGLDNHYGSQTPFQELVSSASDLVVTMDISSLQPNTTYHYRTLVLDSAGAVVGPDQTFTTEPLSTEVLAQGAGIDGEPDTTVIQSFGAPSIAGDGSVVVLANLSTATGPNTAILKIGTPSTIVARKGGAAPSAGNTTAVFGSFSDPVCDGTGRVAFAAKTLDGKLTEAGLWTDAPGSLQSIALVGGSASDTTKRFTAITSYAMSKAGTVFYGGAFAGGSGLWAFDGTGNHLLLKTGDLVSSRKIATIAALTPVAGSTGQGRGYRDNALAARVTFTNGTQGIVELSPGTEPIVVGLTPLPLSIHPPITLLKSLGLPDIGAGQASCFRGVTTGSSPIIVNSTPAMDPADVMLFTVIARAGNDAPGIDSAIFTNFADPVFNAQAVTAFTGTVSAPGVTAKTRTGVWQTAADGSLVLVAQAGTEPPGASGAVWSSFTSLALPDNAGPIFLAKVSAVPLAAATPAGAPAESNTGLWGIDSTGALRLLVRTGDVLHVGGVAKALSLLNLLEAAPGSPGQARSYNDAGDLVFRATFTDHTQAIMRLHLP